MIDNIHTNLINIDKAIAQQRIASGSPERIKQAFAGPVNEAKQLSMAAAQQYDQQLLYNKRLAEAKQKEKRNARKREMEKLPTLNQAKIPQQDLAMITAESQGLRQQYLQNLQIMEQNDPFSNGYLQAKTSNDNILSEFQNINSTYTQLQTLSEEWLKASDDDMISDGLSAEDEDILDTILRKKYDKSYIKDRKLHWEWEDNDGNKIIVNEDNLPQWFNKSKTGGTQYFNIWNKYTKAARAGTKYDDDTIKMQFRNTFDQIDGDGIISMAFDDISSTGQTFNDWYDNAFAGGTIEGPYMNWRDRGNLDELKERLVDWYSNIIKDGMGSANKEYYGSNNNTDINKYGKNIDTNVAAGAEFTIGKYQVVKYGNKWVLFKGTSTYPYFDEYNPNRNTMDLSGDMNKRKQQILDAVMGDIGTTYDWTEGTDWTQGNETETTDGITYERMKDGGFGVPSVKTAKEGKFYKNHAGQGYIFIGGKYIELPKN